MSDPQQGLIFNIQRFSLQDGPGIRTTVFFKGCPLRCVWCHNPEGINPEKELFFKSFNCDLCGKCVNSCPLHAISIEKSNLLIERETCDHCGACVQACPNKALELCGKRMTTDEILEVVMRDHNFYETSNGGLTLSGGEPLMQLDFARSLLKEAKARDLHVVLDTSGYIEKDSFKELLKLIDLILFDVKTLDKNKHKELTGVLNDPIITNLKKCLNYSIETIVRIPIIFGYNFLNIQDELTEQIMNLKEFGVSQFHLIPYHKFGEQKYLMLDKPYSIEIESNPVNKIKKIGKQLSSKFNINIKIIEPLLT